MLFPLVGGLGGWGMPDHRRDAARAIAVLALVLLSSDARPAAASPIAQLRSLDLRLAIQGLVDIRVSSIGSVAVDPDTGAMTVPAGAVAADGPIVLPVTGTTVAHHVTVTGLANRTGVFSMGGVTNQAPQEICQPFDGWDDANLACVEGGGFGGVMGLTGTLIVWVIPDSVYITVDLAQIGLGVGGSTNWPFTFDAAPWTTRTGVIFSFPASGGYQELTIAGGPGRLVSPTFVHTFIGVDFPIISGLGSVGLTVGAVAVPEPGSAILLGLGGAGVFGLAASRRRRRSAPGRDGAP